MLILLYLVEADLQFKSLEKNPGLLPVQLGPAKVEQYSHKIIHYYELSSILDSLNKLDFYTNSIKDKIKDKPYYNHELKNHLLIINNTRNNIYDNLYEIIPKTSRPKRGIINVVGTIFKAITGNLDSDDGERYEKAISELEKNQNTLNDRINEHYSLSQEIIDKFNSTVYEIYQNEIILEQRLSEAETILAQKKDETNLMKIIDTLNLYQFMYQSIERISDKVMTSISFAKLQTLHPSIISIHDLHNSLLKLKTIIKPEKIPFQINDENLIDLIKLIRVDCYFNNNNKRLVFILNFPIYHPYSFNLYKLYPVPVWYQSNQFKLILPDARYLLLAESHSAHETEDCQQIKATYYCKSTIIENVSKVNCETNIVLRNSIANCTQHNIEVTDSQILQIENTEYWISIAPEATPTKLECKSYQKVSSIQGSHLFTIPEDCTFELGQQKIQPTTTEVIGRPLLFEFKENILQEDSAYHPKKQIKPLNLSDFNDMKNLIKFSRIPPYKETTFNHHYILYGALAIIIILLFCKGKIVSCIKSKAKSKEDKPTPQIRLPSDSVL